MKKLLFSILIVLSMGGAANGQILLVDDVEVVPGGTAYFTLTADVGSGFYSGFQFGMQFPVTGFSTTGNATAAESWTNGTFFVGDLAAGFGRVSALSTTDQPIPAGEMSLGRVEFTVDAGIALGDYDVTMSEFNFLDGTNYTPVGDVTFTIHVVERLTVTLYENSTTAPVAATDVNVKVMRTIKANEWSTLVLPFDMSAAQVKTAFGDDVQLVDFTAWSSEEDSEGDIVGIEMDFSSINAIKANHPCLIKVSSAVEEFTVDGVNIDAEDKPIVQVGKKMAERGYLIGTYVANTVVPENNLFLSDNKFWYSAGMTKLKAFCAYFDLYDMQSEVENAEARVRFVVDEEAMDISDIVTDSRDGAEGWYTLDGRKLGGKPTEKGIYIVNGKKMSVK